MSVVFTAELHIRVFDHDKAIAFYTILFSQNSWIHELWKVPVSYWYSEILKYSH